jgi:RNA polymerase II-associated factor 1
MSRSSALPAKPSKTKKHICKSAKLTNRIPQPPCPFHVTNSSFSYSKIGGIKRNFTTNGPEDPAYVDFDTIEPDEDGNMRKSFKFENIRTYETSQQVGDTVDHYGDVVAMALHDPDRHKEDKLRQGKMQKAAYFYPIIQKTSIRPRRPGRVDMVDESQRVDVIEAAGREPAGEGDRREAFRKRAEGIEV